MDPVIVDIQLLLGRIAKIERRITSDHKLVRACHRAARLVSTSLKNSTVTSH
jgi:hypothetical protein